MSEQTKETFFKGYPIIFDLDVSVYAKAVYLYLSKCKDNKTNKCFPCHYQIAKACNCGVTKVKSAIKELESINILTKDHRFLDSKKGKITQTSNEYIIYSKPYNQVINTNNETDNREVRHDLLPDNQIINANNETENREEQVDILPDSIHDAKPIHMPIENKKPTPPSCNDYKTIALINKKSKDNSLSITLTKQPKDDIIDNLDYIFNNCMLDKYDLPLREILMSTIINIYTDTTKFSKRKKIPIEIVQAQMKKLNIAVTDTAISNYKYALNSLYPIENHNLYFESCLWNAGINSYIDNLRIDNVS